MTIDHNGPADPYAGPSEKPTDVSHYGGSGLEKAQSEPKQGAGEAWSQKRPEDWNPPPGNPGSDQDSQLPRDNGTARTDDGPKREPSTSPDDVPSAVDMKDVDVNNSVSSEHPPSR